MLGPKIFWSNMAITEFMAIVAIMTFTAIIVIKALTIILSKKPIYIYVQTIMDSHYGHHSHTTIMTIIILTSIKTIISNIAYKY